MAEINGNNKSATEISESYKRAAEAECEKYREMIRLAKELSE